MSVLLPIGCKASADAAPTTDAGVLDSTSGDEADASSATNCPVGVDAGVSSLDNVDQLCASPAYQRMARWDEACAGSVIVVAGSDDCGTYWLFDENSHALQATATNCNVGPIICTGAVAGFTFPARCFDPARMPTATLVCAAEASVSDAPSD